jgi:hypothetical protein
VVAKYAHECGPGRASGVQCVYDDCTMRRSNGSALTILVVIAACGGKTNGGNTQGTGDPGTGQGGATAVGTAGSFDPGVGGGNSSVTTGSGGANVPCGAVGCSELCCNPDCSICGSLNGGCPKIGCGMGGSTGMGGATMPSGSCVSRIPGPLPCPNEAACTCNSCSAEVDDCVNDPRCQAIWQCELKFNCHGADCYQPQTCRAVIDQYGGPGSMAMALLLRPDRCMTMSGCGSCAATVDAGLACGAPAPPVGVTSCMGDTGGNTCSETCSDNQMNLFSTKCAGTACTCYYNGAQTCSCFHNDAGPPIRCGDCCPRPGWP